MKAREFLKLSMSRDVEARRMLSFRCSEPLWDRISVIDPSVHEETLLSGFRGGEVMRHRLRSSWRGDVL